jgi:hypothetical protein
MSKPYDIFGPAVVNYWADCLGALNIDSRKISDAELAEWINEVEQIVMENILDTIPDEWFPEDDIDEDDDEEWEDLPDDHHDED